MIPILDGSNNLKYEPYLPGENIEIYSDGLSQWLHYQEIRQNGESYYYDHTQPIAYKVKELNFHPLYEPIFISASLLHDVIENRFDLKIHHPYSRNANLKDTTTLNTLFRYAGKQGRQILYCVNKITDKYSDKFEYMNSLLQIKEPQWLQILDLGTLAIKTADIWANNKNPEEKYIPKNNSLNEQNKKEEFLKKKLRNLLHMKYLFLPKIEEILVGNPPLKIEGIPLYSVEGIEKLLLDIDICMENFLRLNPPEKIVEKSRYLGEHSLKHKEFYENALNNLLNQRKKTLQT